ncbi:MAG: NAD(P)-dependent oxidoreductase [Candidatus Omnitrophota bacterium]|nr:NAD(P)-dependent oxidoreductase [Candidatus Omnitrophota bacterium]
MDVMFYEVFREEEIALKRHLLSVVDAGFTADTVQEHKDEAAPSNFISVRTQSVIPLEWARSVNGILTRSTGYDHLIAYRERSRTNIPCGYLPEYCARAVAEHALLVLMALLRKLPRQMKHFDTFNRDGLTGVECLGKNLLVIGVGHIGEMVASLGASLGMQVRGVDIIKRVQGLHYVSLKEGLPAADVIVCALPLTEQTQWLLNYDRLQYAKRDTILVNVSRGEITPVQDLIKLLDEGVLGGLALDVYENEPVLAEYLRSGNIILRQHHKTILTLRGRDNVILTPHNAFNTLESIERKAAQSVEVVMQFLESRTFPFSVPPA